MSSPAVDAVVVGGDGAGWSNPVTGQGLAAALGAVHLGPWRTPDEAFAPSILTTVALA